ncbi:MAG TPA: hypothetical protein VN493_18560 [Thermoanaerobaculia bacterium]|nr:hypothetical protein [Thermoanaerobaculia bacterium]
MGSKLSVSQVVANLEARLAFHRQQEAFHSQQEGHHREQRALHAAEMEKVQTRLEPFRAAAESVEELAEEPVPGLKPKQQAPDFGPGRPNPTRVIRAVVGSYDAGESFGANSVAAEVNRRHPDKLDAPVDGRAVSVVLRRMRAERKIHLVRPGKAHYEALYSRGSRPKE